MSFQIANSIDVRAAGFLLDIEGTTSSISFVHDIMFPYVRQHLDAFLSANFKRQDVAAACEQIARDAGHDSLAAWSAQPDASARSLIVAEVLRLMDGDVKATGLKLLQGLIWETGFRDGSLRAHVYPDVIPQIRRWRDAGSDVRIYSSGSIATQKLFFAHLDGPGNCLDLLSGHYDTTVGSKKEAASYQRVAEDWGLAPHDIVFISDIAGELTAASEAGLQAIASVRPGNGPLPERLEVPRIDSFEAIQLRDI